MWKNVTPPGLPPGGRVHTIEDSPHRRGSAYVSVYRMYLNDFKPYLYMTNDYGAHWTLLTDGTNGIPSDQPMHVVREDPEQEGLLYAGTLQGAYVSFDQGKHWQSLQQNLPNTPVTDFKVHHGDLLASTMGRAFWILDDVSPLRQIAASINKPARMKTSTAPPAGQVGRVGQVGDVALASMQIAGSGSTKGMPAKPAGTHGGSLVETSPARAPVKAAIKPFDGSNVFLFTPAPAYRVHYQPLIGRPDQPEYPAAGARIDYYLASPSGEVKLEILDAAGTIVRSYSSEGRAAAGGRGGRRGGGLPSTLPVKVGMNRFVWDLRYAGGPATAGDGEGGGFAGGGPLVAPGAFKARLTAGGVTRTESFTVKIDPRIAKDGTTVADLVEQAKFSLKVRDALAEARAVQARVRQAVDAKRGDQGKLQAVWDRLTTKTGPYEDQMFVDQLSNVNRAINEADQKVPASYYERFNQLMKEWTPLKADAEAAMR
jgi:hypothetical protein